MNIKNGEQVKIVSREGDSFHHPIGTILTVVDAEDTNFNPPKPAPCCVDSRGNMVWVLMTNLEKVSQEPTEQASGVCPEPTIDHINSFTKHHKDIEISFENGKMEVRDWRGKGDPVEYTVDTVEQFEELMGALATTCKYC